MKNKEGDIRRGEKEIIDRKVEFFEELLNVKCEKQAGDDEEDDIGKQEEEKRLRNEN